MARLYADEQFPRRVVELLRSLGYDVLTVQEADQRGLSDEAVLAFATQEERAVLTLNRRDFFRLHQLDTNHGGIIACTDDPDRTRMADHIHTTIEAMDSLAGQEVRIYKSM
jgi:predicted nuclease of predicted toxin-antitoxin system